MKLHKHKVDLKYVNPDERKPSYHDAIISLLLGLCSFIPLLNYGVSLLAMYISYKTLQKIKHHPQQIRGKWLAAIGLLLGFVVAVVNVIDLVYLRWI